VRQRLFAWHGNRSDFYLREKPGAAALELDKVKASKFCLAQHGVGFGMRQFNAIAAGCVPLVVENLLEGDELRTDVAGVREKIASVGAEQVLCVLATIPNPNPNKP